MLRAQKRKADLSGKGIYVFRNNTSGELFLPRATKSGITKVRRGEEFQGDDYYMFMVRVGELRLVRTIEHPPSETINENTNMDNKLITEQPPVVTNDGVVEFVEPAKGQKRLNESDPNKSQPDDILLTENPLDGVEII